MQHLAGRRLAALPTRCRRLLLPRQSRCWSWRRPASSSAAPSSQPSREPHGIESATAPQPPPPPPSHPHSASAVEAGSASTATRPRSRAARHTQGYGYPPVHIPQWFLDGHVSLRHEGHFYEEPSSARLNTKLYPPTMSEAEARQCIQDMTWYDLRFDEHMGWRQRDVKRAMETMSDPNRALDIATWASRGSTFLRAAADFVLAVAYRVDRDFKPEPLGQFVRPPLPQLADGDVFHPSSLRFLAERWRATGRSYATIGQRILRNRPAVWKQFVDDCGAFRVALATELCVASVYRTKSKSKPKPSSATGERLTPVLAVTDFAGRAVARLLVERTAVRLGADVIHLDAHVLAEIVGKYLGQDCYANRGPFAMMGYRVDEIAGRLTTRHSSQPAPPSLAQPDGLDAESDPEAVSGGGVYTVSPGQLRSMLLGPEPASSPARVDLDRWDDLKLGHVLDQIVGAADLKCASLPSCPDQPSAPGPRHLVIHVQDLAELTELREGSLIFSKLRAAVSRLVDSGRPAVIVGSASRGRLDQTAQPWVRQLSHLSDQLNCHVFHFECPELVNLTTLMSRFETSQINLGNVTATLEAMMDREVSIKLGPEVMDMIAEMPKQVMDVQWAYEIAGNMVAALRDPAGTSSFTPMQLGNAMAWWGTERRRWQQKEAHKEAPGPYHWALTSSSAVASGSGSEVAKTAGSDGQSGNASAKDSTSSYSSSINNRINSNKFDENEKQLMSGIVRPHDIKTTWDSVVCAPETKESLKALTSLMLTRPESFGYGILAQESIHGCLLYGPPGTGKTLMAKAIAKESGATMLEVSAASINDRYVGTSEKNVRALFSLARKLAPAVIFLDEADSLLGARNSRPGRGGYRETVNQFLREWDGLTEMNTFIVVATNRPFDLDEAVLRRLPRKILVDLPLAANRLEILRVLLRDERLDPDTVSLERIAAETELYSGSDLKNLCVAAAMEAVKDEVRARDASPDPAAFVFPERRTITGKHFDHALSEISASISPDQDSLKAIRKFDERYGDAKAKRNKARNIGFAVAVTPPRSASARVRREALDDGA